MVTSSKAPLTEADFDHWLLSLQQSWQENQLTLLRHAFDDSRQSLSGSDNGLQAADLLADLGMDPEALAAAMLCEAADSGALAPDRIRERYGQTVAELVQSATYLHRIGDLHRLGQDDERLESLRKMLLAMAQDIRVVLIMLALRLCLMRDPKTRSVADLTQLAQETLDIFAPLANRLGIGQIKWELEDLALRYLEPGQYRTLARALDERRADRERYINRVVGTLKDALRQAGIQGEVSGRAKHIYSIWRKMQRKRLLFDQIFDVRAVRIMVPSVADCYAALGIVHTLWKNIRQEFDDYIANPKENGYQSLHTAVIGPENKTLEVQIRSFEMHRHAELGVAAHWHYKEGGARDSGLEKQIHWFRQMLEWKDDDAHDLLDQIKAQALLDRVYVLTPKGDIVELPQGATPLDFAYHIHTEVGHRCRGARVNGQIVPLNMLLQNGDQVEILTIKSGIPSRDWLSPHLGYLQTSRARAKVRHWFRQQNREKNISAGRQALEQEFRRLGINVRQNEFDAIAAKFKLSRSEELFAAIGSGDLTTTTVVSTVQDLVLPPRSKDFLPITRKSRVAHGTEAFTIRGVGNLLTQIARCCQPVPFEAIVGYITQGRGVTIHRQDCANILNLRTRYPERFIEVDWGQDGDRLYPIDIELEAYDRSGLLRDITTILANERVNVLAVNTLSDIVTSTARMSLTLEITGLEQLSRLLAKISQLPNIVAAYRKN